MVTPVDIVDRVTIADDVPLELPGVSEFIFQQKITRARWGSVHAVVRAHDRIRATLGDGCLKSVQVGVVQVVFTYLGIEVMAGSFRTTMNGVVLRGRDRLEVMGIVPLHRFDERDGHSRSEIRVFTVGFLPSAPAGIPKDVDIGGPEG